LLASPAEFYLVSKPGGEKQLPRKDRHGTYHIDGNLTVADKPTVKNLVQQLTPLLKELGGCKKIFLTPLARYWVGPCCSDLAHHTNNRLLGYLPSLGDAVHALRDNIRDSLYTPNFRALCPNRLVGIGQRSQVPSDEEAARTAAMWGSNPVHPSAAAYRCMAEHLEKDILNTEARYTNPAKQNIQKKPRIDLSLGRANWVIGCSAAARRGDTLGAKPGISERARAGSRAGFRGHSSRGRSLQGSTLSLKRGSATNFRGGRGRRVWGQGG
jgi:hypothetical protein